ncbi:MAG: hypothetical protein ACOYET_08475, partial [Bacillota bacterium]
MKLLVKCAHVVDPINNIDNVRNIVIDGNRIESLETGEVSETLFDKVIDAAGLHAFPGLID